LPNRPEWVITDLGVQLTGSVLTPIYPTISPSELEFVFNDAGVKIVFVANAEIYDRFRETFAAIPTLKNIYCFDQIPGVANWKELTKGKKHPNPRTIDAIKTETLATIIYTSGTTGEPKGVMLTHSNIVNNVLDSTPAFTFATPNSRALSFLPLNHIFERTLTYIYMLNKVSIYYAESMDTIGANLKEVQPLVFTTVPRLLEKVYERIMHNGMQLKGIKRKLFFWAVDLGMKYDNINQGSAWYRFQLNLADKLIYSRWREGLGNSVKAIVVGSAACQVRLVRIFTAAKVVIMEGYGLTETSPVVCVNRFESKDRRIGTIGPLINNVQVRLAEDGEILVKGKNVMLGYYKRPELTAEAMDGEWLKTGDIGAWVENRFLKITDRKKEIFKTSGGKYVSPLGVENKMKESPYIQQMMVLGDARKFVSALIVPDFKQVTDYLAKNYPGLAIPESHDELAKMKQVSELLESEVNKYNELFSHPEQVKKIKLLPAEWTIDTGELTPSLKIKRKVIAQKYAKEIEDIYKDE